MTIKTLKAGKSELKSKNQEIAVPVDLELHPDAWERFEGMMKLATKPKAKRESAKADPRPPSDQKSDKRG